MSKNRKFARQVFEEILEMTCEEIRGVFQLIIKGLVFQTLAVVFWEKGGLRSFWAEEILF